ncbi:hypothetical protein GCK72_010918 [Caenorhabditis remanei]|uniref:Uncharacterized protein n=1 Tax=Caenorhabditis remanei TaxID=31234 RepID=A0A6A5H718_CAERE|nr:hypothetical protein GCK72_010918 [Caenorhabditis remanei]KAF1762656.1 hypothetical protein GCK72_010918 [Caenorhabditis remanei]
MVSLETETLLLTTFWTPSQVDCSSNCTVDTSSDCGILQDSPPLGILHESSSKILLDSSISGSSWTPAPLVGSSSRIFVDSSRLAPHELLSSSGLLGLLLKFWNSSSSPPPVVNSSWTPPVVLGSSWDPPGLLFRLFDPRGLLLQDPSSPGTPRGLLPRLWAVRTPPQVLDDYSQQQQYQMQNYPPQQQQQGGYYQQPQGQYQQGYPQGGNYYPQQNNYPSHPTY